jgi:magnesium chelatase subunit I
MASGVGSVSSTPQFPFAAIVGQDEMKRAMLISAVDPTIGGVLVLGDRGTGKSTAVRALAALLPKIRMVAGSRYNRAPEDEVLEGDVPQRDAKVVNAAVPVVDLPLGATEDRVVGALDLERALVHGEKAFEPGLLARANRGYLYIDEVNLLEDHLVDLLIDVAASGVNVVERDGLSVRHPARFVLIGSGNPEEGELRPQLLDRFGLSVEVATPEAIDERVEVIKRRDAFERDAEAFQAKWKAQQDKVRRRIVAAREKRDSVTVSDATLAQAARLCVRLGTDGLRGELTLIRAARAWAAYQGDSSVTDAHLVALAPSALRHRLRRDPLDEAGSSARVHRALEEVFAAVKAA